MAVRFALPLLVTLVACGNSYPGEGPAPIPPPGCLQGDAGEPCSCSVGGEFCRAGQAMLLACVDGIWEQADAWCTDPSSVDPLHLPEDAAGSMADGAGEEQDASTNDSEAGDAMGDANSN